MDLSPELIRAICKKLFRITRVTVEPFGFGLIKATGRKFSLFRMY